MSHQWLMEFLKLYIKDSNLLWLINKYLKAGVITEGVYEDSEEGTAQGNLCRARHKPPWRVKSKALRTRM